MKYILHPDYFGRAIFAYLEMCGERENVDHYLIFAHLGQTYTLCTERIHSFSEGWLLSYAEADGTIHQCNIDTFPQQHPELCESLVAHCATCCPSWWNYYGKRHEYIPLSVRQETKKKQLFKELICTEAKSITGIDFSYTLDTPSKTDTSLPSLGETISELNETTPLVFSPTVLCLHQPALKNWMDYVCLFHAIMRKNDYVYPWLARQLAMNLFDSLWYPVTIKETNKKFNETFVVLQERNSYLRNDDNNILTLSYAVATSAALCTQVSDILDDLKSTPEVYDAYFKM